MTGRTAQTDRMAIVALAVAQAVVVAGVVAIGNASKSQVEPLAYLLALASGAAVLVAMRFPTVALLVGIANVVVYYLAELSPIGVAVPILGVVYLAALAGRAAVAFGISCALIVLSVVIRVLEGGESGAVLAYDTVTNLALVTATVALGALIDARRVAAERQRRLLQLERDAFDRRLDGERLAISRDLHDALGHRLVTAAVYGGVAMEARDDEQRIAALHLVREATATALDELRTAVRAIRTGSREHEDVSLRLVVEDAAEMLRRAGLSVDVDVTGDDRSASPDVRQAAARIIQEATTNVAKHSRASAVTIAVDHRDDIVEVSVRDDGAVDEVADGSGIEGMRERAAALGGTLSVTGGADGLTVRARLPLRMNT